MNITFKYLIDWCYTGVMTVDISELFNIGMVPGGFTKAKCKKLVQFILDNADDEVKTKFLLYVHSRYNKKINVKLCKLILDMAGEEY